MIESWRRNLKIDNGQLAYRPNLQKKDQVWRNTDLFFFLKEKKDIPMISRLCEQTLHSEEVREGAV